MVRWNASEKTVLGLPFKLRMQLADARHGHTRRRASLYALLRKHPQMSPMSFGMLCPLSQNDVLLAYG